jgi:putative transposase
MDEYRSLNHTKWDCKYHVVFIPKCRRKTLYGELRRHLGEVFRQLAQQKESQIEEGHLMPDHVHMMISIPPKYAVSQVVGFIKGKSAILLARVDGERKRNFVGRSTSGPEPPQVAQDGRAASAAPPAASSGSRTKPRPYRRIFI